MVRPAGSEGQSQYKFKAEAAHYGTTKQVLKDKAKQVPKDKVNTSLKLKRHNMVRPSRFWRTK